MTEWKNDIGGCFGSVDKVFANHESDQKRAYDLLGKLLVLNVPWEEVQESFEDWIGENTSNTDHIRNQMAKVRAYLEPWLDHLP